METMVTAVGTSWSALKRKDLRRHRRYAVDAGVLQVSWLDNSGKMKMARTRALNISESGIAIELPEAAAPLSAGSLPVGTIQGDGGRRCPALLSGGDEVHRRSGVHGRVGLASARGRGGRADLALRSWRVIQR